MREAKFIPSCPENIKNQLSLIEASCMLVLKENGPTCFTIKDVNKSSTVKTRIGITHNCSCIHFKQLNKISTTPVYPTYLFIPIAKILQNHAYISYFILYKIFRIPLNNPILWQNFSIGN